ncbi:mucin-5AC-like [Daphnia pulicaria]|uniref:mucin-5AC-like n=1 Tax=Daphnia pulicaria TaxID=35523 RepID=UPI001EEC2673|nr:mucin-5AC-like [Daphnia pulicaria]
MRFFSSLTMLFVGALVMATNLSEVDAFGVRKSNTMPGEEEQHSEMSASESVAAPLVKNRGKVKFSMPKSIMIAAAAQANNNPVPRTRLNRVRTTEAPVNSISRDSAEKDFSLEDQKVKTTTSKVIWWTSSTPSPIISSDSKEQDDTVSSEKMTLPIKSDRVLPVNRFNRFRTTPAPTPVVTRDSIEQVKDDGFVPAVGRAVNKPAMPKSRFNRVRTTAAPQLISRDSLELNDVSLEVVRVNPTASPALNRGRTASRGRQIMNRLNRTQTPVETTTTTRNFILVDSKEVDLSFEDVAILPTTTQAPAGIETTTIGDEVTTSSIFIISKQSDERIDLSTELDDMLTTVAIQGTTTVESEELTGTTVILAKQSNEWDDLDDILLLPTTTATATTTPAPTTPEMAATTLEPTTTEAVTTTTTTTTTTAAPVVTRPQSRGRGKFQQANISTPNQISRVNRIRTTMAPKISGDSDEQKDSIIMAVLTTSAPVSKSRFSRVRASTVRPAVTEDAQKEAPAAAATTTTRSPLLGNRFSRFRASTTTTTAVPTTTKAVEREDSAPRKSQQKKSRFGNNARPGVVRVSVDSGEKDTILIGEVMKVNKANNVVLVAIDSSDEISHVTKAIPAAVRNPVAASRRNPMVRGRMTTARPIVSRHSGEENVSLEDLVFKINPSAEQMKINSPSDAAIVAPVHSDELVIVPVPGGSLLVDVSDEMSSATTLDPISIESAEKDDLTMVVDSAGSPVAVVVDLPDISDEIIPAVVVPMTTTVNPISRESEELPVVQTRTRKVVNRGRLNRKPISQI